MKFLILLLLAFIDPGKIGKINEARSEAKKAFDKGDYATAAAKYKLLADSLGVREDAVLMDLAHSYFQMNDTVNAQNTYASLLRSSDKSMRSIAQQQMGVLTNRQKKYEEALNYFKEALKNDPSNDDARYNYEMIKKKLEEQKKQEQQQQNKDQKQQDQKKDKKDQKENKDNKDQQNKDDQQKKDQEQQQKEQQEKQNKEKQEKEKQQKEQQDKEKQDKEKDKKEQQSSEKLKDMKISEEKAKMVLEAMKNQEIQYLQQNKRKATKPRSKGKPDW